MASKRSMICDLPSGCMDMVWVWRGRLGGTHPVRRFGGIMELGGTNDRADDWPLLTRRLSYREIWVNRCHFQAPNQSNARRDLLSDAT